MKEVDWFELAEPWAVDTVPVQCRKALDACCTYRPRRLSKWTNRNALQFPSQNPNSLSDPIRTDTLPRVIPIKLTLIFGVFCARLLLMSSFKTIERQKRVFQPKHKPQTMNSDVAWGQHGLYDDSKSVAGHLPFTSHSALVIISSATPVWRRSYSQSNTRERFRAVFPCKINDAANAARLPQWLGRLYPVQFI